MSSRAPNSPRWITRDNNREARIQGAIVAYVRLVAPQVTVLHIANGGPGRSLARLVWMGMVPGATDLIIIDEHGLAYMVEVKDADGKLTPAQVEFRDHCLKRKIPWALVRSVNDMAAALAKFGIKTRESKR